ncbi:hypothetical protein [Aquisphaera insulae]|nr:hypothetical protein [Aquisphaera insulae]
MASCPESPTREDCRVWPVDKVDPGVLTRQAIVRVVAAALRARG